MAKKARKLSEVQAERALKEAERKAREISRETKRKVREAKSSVNNDLEELRRRIPMPESLINGERPRCYTDPTGPERFTQERLFCNCEPSSIKLLTRAFKKGEQLIARRVPIDALPVVVMFAAFLKKHEVDLVDDYDALCERHRDHVTEFSHPDKFLSSACCILNLTGHLPGFEGLNSVRIPTLYEELF